MVLNNELKKQDNERRKNILDGEIKKRQERRLRNVLERGLKKKVLISNTTFDEYDDNIGEILEGHLDYDVDRFVEYFLDLIVTCGRIVKIPNGAKIDGRTIYLGSEVVNKNIGIQSDEKREITFYEYLCYPEFVEAFLDDIENLDNSYVPLDNNTTLVGYEDTRKNVNYINFSNCYNVDLEDLNNYYMLKYIFSLVSVKDVKNYTKNDEELISGLVYNDFILGCLKKVSTTNELAMFKKKGKVRKRINE